MLKKSIASDVGFRIPKRNINSLDITFSITLFIITVLFIHETSFFHEDALSAVYMLILLGISFLYVYLSVKPLKKHSYYLAILLLLDILPNLIYQNQPFLKMSNFLFFNIIYAYWFLSNGNHMIKEKESDWMIYDMLHAVFHAPFHFLYKSFQLIKTSLMTYRKNGVKVILGLCLSFPLLFILVPLLMRVDTTFANYIEQIKIDAVSISEWLSTFLFAIPLFLYYLSITYGNVSHKSETLYQEDKQIKALQQFSFLPQTICMTIELVLSTTYFLFFIAEIQGIFSSIGLSRDEFSYADFARQGFFELCVIATINLSLIFFINLTSQNRSTFAIWVEKMLMFFTILFILSAMSKLYLYISAYHALTYLRIYAAWFLCLLLGIFLLLFFRKKDGSLHILWITRFAMAAFLILNMINVPHWADQSTSSDEFPYETYEPYDQYESYE